MLDPITYRYHAPELGTKRLSPQHLIRLDKLERRMIPMLEDAIITPFETNLKHEGYEHARKLEGVDAHDVIARSHTYQRAIEGFVFDVQVQRRTPAPSHRNALVALRSIIRYASTDSPTFRGASYVDTQRMRDAASTVLERPGPSEKVNLVWREPETLDETIDELTFMPDPALNARLTPANAQLAYHARGLRHRFEDAASMIERAIIERYIDPDSHTTDDRPIFVPIEGSWYAMITHPKTTSRSYRKAFDRLIDTAPSRAASRPGDLDILASMHEYPVPSIIGRELFVRVEPMRTRGHHRVRIRRDGRTSTYRTIEDGAYVRADHLTATIDDAIARSTTTKRRLDISFRPL